MNFKRIRQRDMNELIFGALIETEGSGNTIPNRLVY